MIVRNSLIALGLVSINACGDSAPSPEQMNAFKQGLKDNMVFVKGGTFMMGDQGRMAPDYKGNIGHLPWTSDSDNKPAVEVKLSDYSIYKYPVSFLEYRLYRKLNQLEIKHEEYIGEPGNDWLQNNYPARFENWQDARNYCQWAGQKIGQQWDLPTEAQWEYAARDRGENKPYAYAFPANKANYSEEEVMGVLMSGKEEPVGALKPNKIGLYQMNGHNTEVVYDWYSTKWPYTTLAVDPIGIELGDRKVTRGSLNGFNYSENTNFWRSQRSPTANAGSTVSWRCAQSDIKLP